MLSAMQAETLIDRLGYDQLRLSNFIEQLSFAGEITDDLLDKLAPLAKTESAFELFTAALAGNSSRIHEIIAYLEAEEGVESAYQTMGLLASQTVNLNALVLSGNDTGSVAADFSTNPYVLQKLSSYANKIDSSQLAVINKALFYFFCSIFLCRTFYFLDCLAVKLRAAIKAFMFSVVSIDRFHGFLCFCQLLKLCS